MPAPAASSKFLRKITPKSVTESVGIDLLNLPRPVEPRVLYDVFGIVRNASIVADKSGTKNDSIRFSGEFEAVTPDGEIFESGKMFVPVLDDVLYSALMSAKEQDPKAYAEIALRVSIKRAPSGKPSATGYEFDVQKLIATERKPDSPLQRLKAEAAAQQKALAAPAPAEGNAAASSDSATSTESKVESAAPASGHKPAKARAP